MKTITVHCDYCTMQLFYENDTLGKKDDFREVYHVKMALSKNSDNTDITGDFCSFDCFTNKIKGLFTISPIKEDILRALANSLGYDLKRKPQEKLEEKEEKHERKVL